ncbi:MAG: hypothetical protein ABC611_08295 [Candidatus Methanosuratincola petrocarbonis]
MSALRAAEAEVPAAGGLRCEACGRQRAVGEFIHCTEGRGATLKLLCAECLAGHVLFSKRNGTAMVTVVFREGRRR